MSTTDPAKDEHKKTTTGIIASVIVVLVVLGVVAGVLAWYFLSKSSEEEGGEGGGGTSCKKGQYEYKGQCYSSCPTGTKPNIDGTTCIDFCNTGTFYNNGQCLNECPDGYGGYGGACTGCASQLSYKNTCVTTCPQGTLTPSLLPGKCYNCQSGTYFYNGVCVSSCPSETMPINGSCEVAVVKVLKIEINANGNNVLKIGEVQAIEFNKGNIAGEGVVSQTSTADDFYFPGKYAAKNAVDDAYDTAVDPTVANFTTYSQTLAGGSWSVSFSTPRTLQQINIIQCSQGANLIIHTPEGPLPVEIITGIIYIKSFITNPSPVAAKSGCAENEEYQGGFCVLKYEYPKYLPCVDGGLLAKNGNEYCANDFGSTWAYTETFSKCTGTLYKGACYLSAFDWKDPGLYPGMKFTIKTQDANYYVTTKSGLQIPQQDDELRAVDPEIDDNPAILEFQFNNGYLQHVQSGLFVNVSKRSSPVCGDTPTNTLFKLNNPTQNATNLRFAFVNETQLEFKMWVDNTCPGYPMDSLFVNLDQNKYLYGESNTESVNQQIWKLNVITSPNDDQLTYYTETD